MFRQSLFRQSLLRKMTPSVATGRSRLTISSSSVLPTLHEFTLLVKFERNFNPVGEMQRFLEHPRVSFFGHITERETQWGTQKEEAWCLSCKAPSLEDAKGIVQNDASLSKHIEKLEAWAFETVHTSTL